MGPVAEDFHAAFGLGNSDRAISIIDADGVALAAIQGLHQKLQTENASLRDQNAALLKRLEAIELRLGQRESAARDTDAPAKHASLPRNSALSH